MITPPTGDVGIDLIVGKTRKSTLVQCKAHKDPIGPGPVRELYGVISSRGIDGEDALIVCLGGFTKGAIDFARKTGIRTWKIDDVIRFAGLEQN